MQSTTKNARCIHVEFSVPIFYLDLTYSFSDAIREYDAIAVFSNGKHRFWLCIEDLSTAREYVKSIVDLTLWSPPIQWSGITPQFQYNVIPSPSIAKFIKELLPNQDLKDVINRINKLLYNVRKNSQGLLNIINYSVITLSEKYLQTILGDFEKLSDIFKDSLQETKTPEILSINYIIGYTKTLTGKIEESPITKLLDQEITEKKLEETISKEADYYIFPQKVSGSPNREKHMSKIIAQFAKIAENNKIYIISNNAISRFVKGIVEEIPKPLRSMIKQINMEENNLADQVKIKRETAILIVLQDYKKNLFKTAIEDIAENYKTVIVLVIPEVTYQPLEKDTLEYKNGTVKIIKRVSAVGGFMLNKLENNNLTTTEILVERIEGRK